jgi:hypothetical protein
VEEEPETLRIVAAQGDRGPQRFLLSWGAVRFQLRCTKTFIVWNEEISLLCIKCSTKFVPSLGKWREELLRSLSAGV